MFISHKNIFVLGHVSYELKSNRTSDCGFNAPGHVRPEDIDKLTEKGASLILQILRYTVLGQFSTLPYRYVLHVTITGDLLRIWKVSPTGIEITTAISYTKDPKAFVAFLLLMRESPSSGIGLEVGEGRLFQELPSPIYEKFDDIDTKMKSLAKLYAEQASEPEWYAGLAKEPGYWILDPNMKSNHESKFDPILPYKDPVLVFRNPIHRVCSITTRSTRCYLAVELSLLDKDFDKMSKEDKLRRIHLLKTQWQDSKRAHEYDFHAAFVQRRTEQKSGKSSHVATVLAGGTVPNTANQFGHSDPFVSPASTTVENLQIEDVAEIEKAFEVQGEEGNRKERECHPRSVYYLRKGTYKGAPQPGLSGLLSQAPKATAATAAAAAEPIVLVPDSVQTATIKRERPSSVQCPKKELRWVLFKQVGGRLKSAANVKEMVQVLSDAVEGKYLLVTLFYISSIQLYEPFLI